jgi:hypothetical protein
MWRQNELQKKKKLSLESTTRDLIHWACSATRIVVANMDGLKNEQKAVV